MFKQFLLSSVAITALIAGAPSAFAQTAVNQSATNNSTVTNTGPEDVDPGTMGLGTSASVGATGAMSSTSDTGLNANFIDPIDGFADVTQKSLNSSTANVTNTGTITVNPPSSTGVGSSISVGANGALSSLSVTGVGGTNFTAPVADDITQRSENNADIANSATMYLNGLTLAGNGSSVSANAGGAFASVSVSGINALSFKMGEYGDIKQTVINGTSAPVTNTVKYYVTTGDLDGAGASVSTGASGATAAVGASFISVSGTVTGTELGDITQSAKNGSDVTNTYAPAYIGITTTDLDGNGTSVSTSASGAVASVGVSNINVTTTTAITLNDIKQTASNGTGSDVSNGSTGAFITTGNLDGIGSSVSSSATGAVAAVGFNNINVTNYAGVTGNADITQTAKSETGTVSNQTPTISVGALTGVGSAVSSSATGTLASISFGSVSSKATSGFLVDDIAQTSSNKAKVTNTTSTINTSGNLSGNGSSVSSGASGAVASTAVTNINSTAKNSTMGYVKQTATNSATGDVTNSASTLNIGAGGSADLSGAGSSASISANGSLAALSLSSIVSTSATTTIGTASGKSVTQTSNNSGSITNTNGIINVDDLTGIGTSAVVSATGAAASVSVSSIADTSIGSVDINGSITQVATNNAGAPISNTGSINAGTLSGTGASLSISAVGAGAFTSFHAVK